MLKFFSKISSAADLLLTEARISDSYRKKLSKSKPSLYLLMDSSKLLKGRKSIDKEQEKDW